MGGAGLAVMDPLSQNYMNPALMVDIVATAISGGVKYESIRFEQPSRYHNLQQTSFNNFSFTVKATQNFAFGTGLSPYSDTDYEFIYHGPSYTRVITATGGTSKGFLGAAYRINNKLALGVNYMLLFGTDSESWLIEFDDDLYSNSDSEITRNKWGSGVSIGMTAHVIPRLYLGGVIQSEIDLNINNRIRYYESKGTVESSENSKIPFSFGIGTAFSVGERVVLVGDLFRWQFNDLSYTGTKNADFRNSTRFSAGIELLPSLRVSDRLLKRIIYRLGFYYWDLYSHDPDLSPLSEKFVTAGFSVPFLRNQARLDIALEGGMRSSKTNYIGSEKIFRIHVDLVGGEVWFRR